MFGDRRKATLEQTRFLTRIAVLVFCALCVVGFLAARIVYLTVARGQELFDYSEYNMLRRDKIPAPRGNIEDRYGRLLATCEPRFDLSIHPYKVKKEQIAETLLRVAALCPQAVIPSVDSVMKLKRSPRRLPLASNLTVGEALPIVEQQALLPGLHVEQTFTRVYPHGTATAFLTGYVSSILEKETQARLEEGYDLNDTVGRAALESKCETVLRGEKGTEVVRRDAFGFLLDSRTESNAVPGARIVLTVDLDLQLAACDILTSYSGVIVAMDPRNGDVLAMASNPTFDANLPDLANKEGNSSWNKAIRTGYAPGSAFKLVTATAYLLSGGSPARTYYCAGTGANMGIANRPYMQCDAKRSHGATDLRRAITVSCNMYFFDAAARVGLAKMLEVGALYGFGRPTGIGLVAIGESPGRLGVTGATNLADLHMMAIGQGRMILVTPLQMVNAYSALANGGTLFVPQIVKRTILPSGEVSETSPTVASRIPWTPEQRAVLVDAFRNVVADTRSGTGRNAGFDPAWKVAGKTSSAQRATTDGKVADAGFVCFAPADNPEICLYVVLEGVGHGGEFAAPVAKLFLDEYYRLKKTREGS
jgi:penicillin-binding protein 2